MENNVVTRPQKNPQQIRLNIDHNKYDRTWGLAGGSIIVNGTWLPCAWSTIAVE